MSSYEEFAPYYDLLTQNVDYDKRADYFLGLLREFSPDVSLVLDLACGTGSLTIELAKRGMDMIGTDESVAMLGVAMNKAVESQQRILFLNQSMQELDLYGTVDGVVCTLDSLNHLPDEENLEKVFSRLALFCAPGGVLIFDVNTSYKHRILLANEAYVYETDEVYCVWQNQYLGDKDDTVEISLDFFSPTGNGGYSRRKEFFQERIFSFPVLDHYLQKTNFTIEAVYDELTHDEPKEDSQRLIYVVRRNQYENQD